MKFAMAVMVFLFMAFMLGWGILLAVRGQYWLLITAAAAYLLVFGLVGCLPRKSH